MRRSLSSLPSEPLFRLNRSSKIEHKEKDLIPLAIGIRPLFTREFYGGAKARSGQPGEDS
jgi:hypothetical protein